MNLDEYIKNLKVKYNYSDDLCTLLKKIIPCLITYYGSDKMNLILSAIEDTEIHFQGKDEDIYEFLENFFLVKKKWNIPYNGEAFLENEYILTKSVVLSRNLIYIKQIFLGDYVSFDYNDSVSVSNLVHELCHLVKSYGTLKFDNNKIYSKSGLINEYYQCNIIDGLLSECKIEYVGLEEALNTIDEEEILKMLNMSPKKDDGYSKMSSMLRRLLLNEDIKESFKKAEFSEYDWTKCLGDDGIKLSEYFDEWFVLNLMPSDIIINDDKYIDRVNVVKKNIDFIISKYENKNIKS